jgi:ABC-type multidrug transport system ATPase subunit
MRIDLDRVGKKYHRDWIFKNLSLTLAEGARWAVTGPNGSGKSTLIQIIAGNLLCTAGNLTYRLGDREIDPDDVFRELALVAPYLELPEELTLMEFLRFHFEFKQLKAGYSIGDLPGLFQLLDNEAKTIRHFSTGMKQRLKLGVAFVAEVPLILLDEPATNLDGRGFTWYLEMISHLSPGQILVISSNRKEEYGFCTHQLDLLNFKN